MNQRTRPVMGREAALRLAEEEYARCSDLFAGLGVEDWRAPTECAGWDVRRMAAHLLGMVEMVASPWETVRQNIAAMDGLTYDLDRLTALQVREREDWAPARIAARYAARWPAALRARRRLGGVTRGLPLPPLPVNGRAEVWTLGYLVDVILTRDPWTHRMDISRALDWAPSLTAEHDGAIVADVVAEWAARHGRPFSLELTGPAGGTFASGSGGPHLELDAVEFCRVLSRRTGVVPLEELLGTEVPF